MQILLEWQHEVVHGSSDSVECRKGQALHPMAKTVMPSGTTWAMRKCTDNSAGSTLLCQNRCKSQSTLVSFSDFESQGRDRPHLAARCLPVCRPGGFCLAFGLHAGRRDQFKAKLLRVRTIAPEFLVRYIADVDGCTNELLLPEVCKSSHAAHSRNDIHHCSCRACAPRVTPAQRNLRRHAY